MKLYYWAFLLFQLIPVTAFPQRVYPYSYHNKYGLIDDHRRIVLEPKHKRIELFPAPSDNPYTVFSEYDTKGDGDVVSGIIDKKGKVVVPARFTKLEYDGNKKYAFSINSFNTIEVIDILTGKGIHKQTYSNYVSKEGLVVIREQDGDTHTMIFQDHTIRQHKGYVNIVPTYDSYYYECSDGKTFIYYDIDGKLVKGYSPGGEVEMADMSDNDRKKNDDLWNDLKEKFGETSLTPVLDDYKRFITCAIYKDPASGKYKLLNPEGQVIFEDEEVTAMSGMNDHAMYIQFKKGDYWGIVTYMGDVYFKPEFNNIKVLSKGYRHALWLEHRSGYSGVGTLSGLAILPKESGYH